MSSRARAVFMTKDNPSTGDSMRCDRAKTRSSRDRLAIACFVSPHGYGHAARAAAVMAAIHRRATDAHFEIFTTVPAWFFENSLDASFSLHPIETDVGFVQTSPFVQNLETTHKRLDRFLPFDSHRVGVLARRLRNRGCCLTICDISPLGIAVGQAAGVPTVLIENFTWDWLYAGYEGFAATIEPHVHYLKQVFDAADLHIQTEPVCAPRDNCTRVGPISRSPRCEGLRVRNRLGIPIDKKMVLVTTGGVPDRYEFLAALNKQPEVVFVIPGGARRFERRANLILLPVNSEFFHPDLVAAADAVVGKVGYSTLAEVYAAGVPFGYVLRSDFRESPVLADFIRNKMTGLDIDVTTFYNGDWLPRLSELLVMPRQQRQEVNGAAEIAELLSPYIDRRPVFAL